MSALPMVTWIPLFEETATTLRSYRDRHPIPPLQK